MRNLLIFILIILPSFLWSISSQLPDSLKTKIGNEYVYLYWSSLKSEIPFAITHPNFKIGQLKAGSHYSLLNKISLLDSVSTVFSSGFKFDINKSYNLNNDKVGMILNFNNSGLFGTYKYNLYNSYFVEFSKRAVFAGLIFSFELNTKKEMISKWQVSSSLTYNDGYHDNNKFREASWYSEKNGFSMGKLYKLYNEFGFFWSNGSFKFLSSFSKDLTSEIGFVTAFFLKQKLKSFSFEAAIKGVGSNYQNKIGSYLEERFEFSILAKWIPLQEFNINFGWSKKLETSNLNDGLYFPMEDRFRLSLLINVEKFSIVSNYRLTSKIFRDGTTNLSHYLLLSTNLILINKRYNSISIGSKFNFNIYENGDFITKVKIITNSTYKKLNYSMNLGLIINQNINIEPICGIKLKFPIESGYLIFSFNFISLQQKDKKDSSIKYDFRTLK